MNLPTTAHGLYQWNAALLIGYLAIAASLDALRRRRSRAHGRRDPPAAPADWLFNGTTFSASLTLLAAVFSAPLMRLVGDTTAYLTFAGVAGLGYSLRALFPSADSVRPITPARSRSAP